MPWMMKERLDSRRLKIDGCCQRCVRACVCECGWPYLESSFSVFPPPFIITYLLGAGAGLVRSGFSTIYIDLSSILVM